MDHETKTHSTRDLLLVAQAEMTRLKAALSAAQEQLAEAGRLFAAESEKDDREIAHLHGQLAAAQAELEKVRVQKLDEAMDTVMNATEDQINAALRLEGHDPKDVSTIGRQVCEIALLKHELTRERSAREEAERDAERYRWLRQLDDEGYIREIFRDSQEGLDAAIDAARSGGSK